MLPLSHPNFLSYVEEEDEIHPASCAVEQVLLSQSHRFRALILLGRFLDMGAWAVDLVISDCLFEIAARQTQIHGSCHLVTNLYSLSCSAIYNYGYVVDLGQLIVFE